MNALYSLFAIILLILIVFLGAGVAGWQSLFGIIIPYLALTIFLVGVVYRVVKWGRAPVPFRITTTCGQAKSLGWIKNNNLESPHNTWGVLGRMALEVLFFRSLFRNTKSEMHGGPKLAYGSEKLLWAGSLAFHWSFLIIFIRHFRFFTEPVPAIVTGLQFFDGFVSFASDVWHRSEVRRVEQRRSWSPSDHGLRVP